MVRFMNLIAATLVLPTAQLITITPIMAIIIQREGPVVTIMLR